jgi:diguanylate cyclase (GGDEF)-like protein
MRNPLFRPGHRGAAAALARAMLLVVALWALAAVPRPAQARCFPITDPDYLALDPLVIRNATEALRLVNQRLTSLAAAGQATDPRRLAALYAVQADAYGMLELDHPALAAGAKGLRLLHGPTDPLRLEMLSEQALNIYAVPGIRAGIAGIEAARALQPPGSRSAVCLDVALGLLELRIRRYALATRTLTGAYRDTESPQRAAAHIDAAVALSSALRILGDYPEALTLLREQIRWDVARGNSLRLSVTTYLEGEVLAAMGDFSSALETFERSGRISGAIGDDQGVAFADMEVCHSLVELGKFDAARSHCDRAARTFAASGDASALKETREFEAQIDLRDGRAAEALGTLDAVLDHDGVDIDPHVADEAYRTRSEANAELHDYRTAYADLAEFLRREQAGNRARQAQLQDTIKERARAEQEVERNAALQRQLELTQQRETRQKKTLRWADAAGAAGVLLIGLLSYTLITNLRHRRQLIRLASEDSLTGMPNRGRTMELASAALAAAAAQFRPLTVAIIDLDHFKSINDRCGHAAGDYVLKEFARLSRGSLRVGDILGRWGGEEFLLILPDTTLDAALASVERLRVLALAIQVPGTDTPVRVTFSAGLATTADGPRSLDEIIARADAALYEAKHDGRDLVRIDRESYRNASTGVRRALRSRST